MKYLKKFNESNEDNYKFFDMIKKLSKSFERLGINIKEPMHHTSSMLDGSNYESYTEFDMSFNLGKVTNSPLYWLFKFLSEKALPSKPDTFAYPYPIFDEKWHKDRWNNDLVFTSGITNLSINLGTSETKFNDPNRMSYLFDIQNEIEARSKILSLILEWQEATTGKYKSRTHDYIIDAPYIKELIINYIKLVMDNKDNYDSMVKLFLDAITQSKDVFKIVSYIEKNDSYLYLTLKHFNKNIGIGNEMGNLGF